MKDRPILFTPANAQKVHLGTKTQTRRIMKPQPQKCHMIARDAASPSGYSLVADLYDDEYLICPYGAKGDKLWVRECFWRIEPHPGVSEEYSLPKGDPLKYGGQTLLDYWKKRIVYDAPGMALNLEGRKYPSIHMPRWACRTGLELTAVRVERLQEISGDDCIAEGIDPSNVPGIGSDSSLINAYRDLWESINGKGSWALNPWVWVLTFKRA